MVETVVMQQIIIRPEIQVKQKLTTVKVWTKASAGGVNKL